MKKIITAINNPQLNEELKKEKNFEIIGKDIQYREAILEILEENDFIDLIIMSEKILGEISLENLIEKIRLKNEAIKIIFILEKENDKLEKILIKNNILDIYYNNKINLQELIKIINKKEINMEEEIIKLKKIIEEKEHEEYKEKEDEIKLKNKIKNFLKIIKKTKIKNTPKYTKVITFSGNYKSGKSTLALAISQCLSKENEKVLLIDGDLEKQDLSILLKKEKSNKKTNEKKLIISHAKHLEKIKYFLKKEKMANYKIKNFINFGIKKLSKNLYFFCQLNEKLFIKNINYFFYKIKEKYNFIIFDLSKNNFNKLNEKILKNSDFNFLIMESDLLGIKEIKKLLEKYINEIEIEKEKIQVVINKKSRYSISKKVVSNCINSKNKIFEIRENKIYSIFFNHFFTTKYLMKNKKVEKDMKKFLNLVKKSAI